MEDYMVIGEVDQLPRAMSVESIETKPQSAVWEAGLLFIVALLQKLLTNERTRFVIRQQGFFKYGKTVKRKTSSSLLQLNQPRQELREAQHRLKLAIRTLDRAV